MTIQDTLQTLDGFFRNGEYQRVEPFLLEHLALAEAAQDKPSMLTLLNELMGFYRGMSRFQEALATGSRALALMEALGYKGSVPYATTLLNVATAYRAAGQTAQAIEMFKEVAALFVANTLQDAYLTASLHNNLSLAYQESGAHEQAIASLEAALPLIQSLPGSEAEVAVTYTNMALSKVQCGRLDEARADLLSAVRLFEQQAQRNSHYGAALAGLGELSYREGKPEEAQGFYERALAEIESHYGKNQYYAITLESLSIVLESLSPARSQALAAEARAIQQGIEQTSEQA
jgi:tetratricopeptide (TPR) repeat protein